MNTAHEVHIDLGGRFCEVDPGELFIGEGDTVTFVNKTKDVVRIFFGGSEPLGKDLIDLPPEERSGPLVVRSPEKTPKTYQYAVYSAARRAFGVGGSNPRIIVLR